MAERIVTTTEQIPGHTCEDHRGSLRCHHAVPQHGLGSRSWAIARLREDADAVVMMRFDSGSIAGDMQSLVAYGTAVKFTN